MNESPITRSIRTLRRRGRTLLVTLALLCSLLPLPFSTAPLWQQLLAQ
jgi:hypothetical protein